MKAKVLLCHINKSYVVCMTDRGHFKYPKRLKEDVATKLMGRVILAGYIDTTKWKED